MQTEVVDHCAVCLGRELTVLDAASALNACRDCGFVFDSPRPTIDELVDFYSQPTQYDPWVRAEAARDAIWQRRLAKMLSHNPSGSLLDVGAGIGQFLHQAQGYFDSVSGTEVSTSAIAIAKDRYGLEIMEGQFEHARIDRCYTTITMFHVLEHVPDPSATVARCVELLEPGGLLFVAVPNDLDAARQRVKRLLARAGVPRYARLGRMALPRIELDGSQHEIHLSHFTVKSLRRLLERHGLAVVEQGLDPYSVTRGWRRVMDAVLREGSGLVARTTGHNLYDTIWMVARKST